MFKSCDGSVPVGASESRFGCSCCSCVEVEDLPVEEIVMASTDMDVSLSFLETSHKEQCISYLMLPVLPKELTSRVVTTLVDHAWC